MPKKTHLQEYKDLGEKCLDTLPQKKKNSYHKNHCTD